ncbi:hypothetical protein ACY2PI_004421 [Citrobacter amalonaticus]
MDVERIVDNHLYNKCCLARTRGVDLLLEDLVTELQQSYPALTQATIVEALHSNSMVALQYREFSDHSKEISLISYHAGYN